jgi:hypothetical protein
MAKPDKKRKKVRATHSKDRMTLVAKPEKKRERNPNNPKDGITTVLITLFFGFVMYISGAGRGITSVSDQRQVLRVVRDHGTNTSGEWVIRDRGNEYFDTKAGRRIRPHDNYVKFQVDDGSFEAKVGEWGAVSHGEIKVRYLASDPSVVYYTQQPDLMGSIRNAIWYRTLILVFLYAIVLGPPLFGAWVLLLCIVPFTFVGFLIVVTSIPLFLGACLYAVL